MAQADRRRAQLADVRAFLGAVYGADLHAKRIDSLAGAALGVMQSASLAVAMIGQALAQAKGLVTKHAIKQIDRMLSNNGIDVWDSFARWVPHQIGTRQEILVAMDWTDFDRDDQATLALHLVHRFHETNLLQGDSIRGAGFPDAVASHPIRETGGCDGGNSEGGRTTHWGEGVGQASIDRPVADRVIEPRGARPDRAALSG
jgi:hypothetical protein